MAKKDRTSRGVPWEPASELPAELAARDASNGTALPYEGLAPGVVLLGRFRLLGDLGEGGLGRVFKARDERFGVDVLLKTLKEPLAADAALVDHFQREIRLAQRIDH